MMSLIGRSDIGFPFYRQEARGLDVCLAVMIIQAFTNSTSSVMVTSSPTRMPPVSSAAFQVRSNSLRLIFVVADTATRVLPQGSFAGGVGPSTEKSTLRVTPRMVRSPSTASSPSRTRPMRVDLKDSVGNFSTSKKSALFRCASRWASRVSIEAASIETRDAQRDAHLKSADFFDVEKFPTLSFKSTRIGLVRDGELAVEGDLTIRGVTRKVLFSVEGPTPPTKDPWGNTRVAVSATTKINRKDFGLTWNTALETGGILVGDEVTFTLDVEFVKA